LKQAYGLVLDKPRKAAYDSPYSFHIIVLLKIVSKILAWVMMVRVSALARYRDLVNPNPCDPFPCLSPFNTYLSLSHECRILQRRRLRLSTLFLGIKPGLDNVDPCTCSFSLLARNILCYIVHWVPLFLSVRSWTLVFHG